MNCYHFDQNRGAQGNVFEKIRKERGKRTETNINRVTDNREMETGPNGYRDWNWNKIKS